MSPSTFYDSTTKYPRDLIGYGEAGYDPKWPGGARIAVQFVLNFEEGGESCVLHGDPHEETFLSEMFNPTPFTTKHMTMDSTYEYGSRQGVWRIIREFDRFHLPLTIFGIATALERNPEVTEAFLNRDYEIAAHGYKWILYQDIPEDVERQHLEQALEIIKRMTGNLPLGWYTGRDSPNTRRLVVEDGRLMYDSDYYGDDLPFWMLVETSDKEKKPHLVVPYTLDANDMRFALPQGYSDGEPFFRYLRDQFDVLYEEGDPAGLARPKMMSVGLHCRMVGRPSRLMALRRFLEYISSKEDVWVTTRSEIARHWMKTHPWDSVAN